MNSISTFDITKEALPDFLLHIQQGKIQLPDLQRSFCWPDDQVKELIASVSLAWPVGAVLLLLLGNSNVKFKPRLIEGVTLKIIPSPSKLILDGQQRSTALFMALFSGQPVWIKEKKSQKIQERWYYIDIEKALDPFVEREEAIISLPASRRGLSSQRSFELVARRVPEILRHDSFRIRGSCTVFARTEDFI